MNHQLTRYIAQFLHVLTYNNGRDHRSYDDQQCTNVAPWLLCTLRVLDLSKTDTELEDFKHLVQACTTLQEVRNTTRAACRFH